MRTLLYRMLALILVAFLTAVGLSLSGSSPGARAGAVAAPNFVVSGRVTDNGRTPPNNGVRATITVIDPPLGDFQTDAQGNYSILNVPAGETTIQVDGGQCLAARELTFQVTGDLTLNIGLNRRLDVGGFGYTCDDQVAYDLTPVPGTITRLTPQSAVSVNLPFAFTFFGQAVAANRVWVTSAGYLGLGQATAPVVDDNNSCIPTASQPNNTVYAYWDFFDTNTNGGFLTETRGSAPNRQFVIEWRDMPLALDPNQRLNFQVIFFEGSNELKLLYAQVGGADGEGSDATIGIENAAGSNALQYICNERELANSTAVRIYTVPVGTVRGTVRDRYTATPLRALVCPSYPEVCTRTTVGTGVYTVTLSAGIHTFEVGAYRRVTETRQVQVVAGQTTTADFALGSPHLSPTPTPIVVCLQPNTTANRVMPLNNTGPGALNYRLREALGPEPVGCPPLRPLDPTAGTFITDYAQTVAVGETNSEKADATMTVGKYRYEVTNRDLALPPPPGPILAFSDETGAATFADTTVGRALATLQWPATGFLNDVNGFFAALNNSYALVIVQNDRLTTFPTTAHMDALQAYMNAGGRMVFQTFDYDNTTVTSTFYSTLGIAQPTTENLLTARDVYQWEPTEFIFRCPNLMPSRMISAPQGFFDYGDYLRANANGLEWAGTELDPEIGRSMIVGRDDGKAVSLGFILSTLIRDDNGNSVEDKVDLAVNIIKYVGNPPIPWGDLTWLSESPVDGSVSPTSTQAITLTFTATNTGVYTGYLFSLNNDPNLLRVGIPVRMEVQTICGVTPTPAPDFAINTVMLSNGNGRPVAGQGNDIKVMIQNVGDGDHPPTNNLYIDVYANWPATPGPGEVPPDWGQYTAALPVSATAEVSIQWVAPPTAGESYFYAWINRDCSVREANCNPNTPGNNRIGPIYACTFATQDYSFQDVTAPVGGSGGNPFFTFIEYLACRQAISGYNCGGLGEPCQPGNRAYFRWGNTTTRGQFSKVLSIAMRWNEAVPSTQQTFQDVPSNSTFWLFIERAASRGVISGYNCGGVGEPCGPGNKPYFRPGNNITRGQVAKVVSESKGWRENVPTTQQTFADVPSTNNFWVFIERIATRGIISGYNCGSPGEPCGVGNKPYYRWGNSITRGQLSKIVVLGVTQP